MPNASLQRITRYCDQLLRTDHFEDYDGAYNGLQVENHGSVSRIAAAVDGSLTTIRLAIAAKCDLLIVHHGLFWSPSHPWTGKRFEMLQLLISNKLAVYSSHLPLDAHPRVGNNARLCAALGFPRTQPFFFERGRHLGLQAKARISREELHHRLSQAVGGRVHLIPAGLAECRRIGVVTGGAGSHLKLAAAEGVDTFITGEGPHWTYALAEELGVNVLYAGHYATETFGVKALAQHLSRRFKVPWTFLNHPTGL